MNIDECLAGNVGMLQNECCDVPLGSGAGAGLARLKRDHTVLGASREVAEFEGNSLPGAASS